MFFFGTTSTHSFAPLMANLPNSLDVLLNDHISLHTMLPDSESYGASFNHVIVVDFGLTFGPKSHESLESVHWSSEICDDFGVALPTSSTCARHSDVLTNNDTGGDRISF